MSYDRGSFIREWLGKGGVIFRRVTEKYVDRIIVDGLVVFLLGKLGDEGGYCIGRGFRLGFCLVWYSFNFNY
jgi:hypothetical protein